MSPNSPGAKDSVEQKPSDDETSNVSPSFDQARSVKVAQCRLLTTQIGVFCCVSYNRTESWVATASTILYGSEKAGLGPGVAALVAAPVGLAGVDVTSGTAAGGGGGSITGAGDVGRERGSGSAGMSSSAEDVSMVMFLVGRAVRRV